MRSRRVALRMRPTTVTVGAPACHRTRHPGPPPAARADGAEGGTLSASRVPPLAHLLSLVAPAINATAKSRIAAPDLTVLLTTLCIRFIAAVPDGVQRRRTKLAKPQAATPSNTLARTEEGDGAFAGGHLDFRFARSGTDARSALPRTHPTHVWLASFTGTDG